MAYFLIFWIVLGLLLRLLPERRTLWFGAVAFAWLGIFYVVVLFTVYVTGDLARLTVAQYVLMALMGIPGLILLLLPVWLVFMFIYNGVVLIRREGFNWRNCLALGLGVGSVAYTFLHPLLRPILSIPGVDLLDSLIVLAMNFVAVELMMYVLTTVANSWHLKRYRLNAIIVLGAGLMGEEVTPLLARRIDKAIAVWRRQKKECYLIMSGGQGADEVISEAEAMRRYAIRQGIDARWILLEDQSTNTEENIRNSYQMIYDYGISQSPAPAVAIVTNYFHIFRAMVIARTMGYQCVGYGAKTKLYYSMNAILRDFVGYFVLTWRKQLTIYAVFAVLQTLFWAMNLMGRVG